MHLSSYMYQKELGNKIAYVEKCNDCVTYYLNQWCIKDRRFSISLSSATSATFFTNS